MPASLPVGTAGLAAAQRAFGMAGVDLSLPKFLVALLRDPDSVVRYAAVRPLGWLGAAATPEVLAALTQLLRDPDKDVRRAAALAVGGLGAKAATPEVLAGLAQLFREADWGLRRAAAEAVG